jgi:hypothetical protein
MRAILGANTARIWPGGRMNKRRLNIDEFGVETFEAGTNPVLVARAVPMSGDGCTVWTTCSPGCDTTVWTPDTQQ